MIAIFQKLGKLKAEETMQTINHFNILVLFFSLLTKDSSAL